MDRVTNILFNPHYQYLLKEIEKAEEERIFCDHNLEHFLDVARLAYIENLEKDLGLSKELIYAAALLHDIGRKEEYEGLRKHDIASADLAIPILKDAEFNDKEIEQVVQAISGHRNKEVLANDNLSSILYRADKQSRNCFCCPAREECNWHTDKMNLKLKA